MNLSKMKIAICGKLCSGKSYLAKHLSIKYNAKIYSFGSNVKKYCKEIFNMKYKDRKLLQDFAQKMREIDSNVWVNKLLNEISEDNSNNIIVDDLRFPNEEVKLREGGFIIIRLIVDNTLQIERIKKTYPDSYKEHIERLDDISESHIDSLDIENTIYIDKTNELKILDLVVNCVDNNVYK